ncbi:MAG: hypothetical protein KGH72_01880 [Candidatus Micrarchaeota archaeon]|nr:hypothetical protein [Candidatus Micrarchaeota archaeon]
MKAQFWSFDGVFGMTIFTIAMLLLASVWINVNRQLSLAYGFGVGSMQQELISIQNRITTQGAPANWNSQVVVTNPSTWSGVSIGLGNGNAGVLSTPKILYLSALASYNYSDYQATKYMLGTGHDYYIIIKSPGLYNMTIGRNPLANNATAIQVANVHGVLDSGQPVTMSIEVWTNTSFGVG